MNNIDTYISEIKNIMRKNGLRSDTLDEFREQLMSEFDDYIEEHPGRKDMENLESEFIRSLENPQLMAVTLGRSDEVETLKEIISKYAIVYFLLIEVFFILANFYNEYSTSHNIYYWIGAFVVIIWWTFPIFALWERVKQKAENDLASKIIILLEDIIVIYGILIVLFLIYALAVGPTQAKIVGGYLGEAILWALVIVLYLVNQRDRIEFLVGKLLIKKPTQN